MGKRLDSPSPQGTEPELEAPAKWKIWASRVIRLVLLVVAAWVGASYSGPLWHVIIPSIIVFAGAELLMDRFLTNPRRRDFTSFR